MSMKDDPIAEFHAEVVQTVASYPKDESFQKSSADWLDHAFRRRYMYNYSWLGRPIIQLPADAVAVQEAIWSSRPDLIIEAGVAHGGSLVLSASILAMLEMDTALSEGRMVDPANPPRRVLGLDIDIRAHNREAIETHPLSPWIEMFEGSSIDKSMIEQVHDYAKDFERVMVILDSNHTHDHVLAELEAYAPLVSKGAHCLVFDTAIETLAEDMFPDRPWSHGDNPLTAIAAYQDILSGEGRTASDGESLQLELDTQTNDKLLLTAAPGGFLRRT